MVNLKNFDNIFHYWVKLYTQQYEVEIPFSGKRFCKTD